MSHITRDYNEDPEFGDPDDPEWRHELFRLMRVMGKTPEDITNDPTLKEQYAEWLKTTPPEED